MKAEIRRLAEREVQQILSKANVNHQEAKELTGETNMDKGTKKGARIGKTYVTKQRF